MDQKKTSSMPCHVAIIPDGNRRWAAARGEKPWEGHRAGAQCTEEIIYAAGDLGIEHLSFWGSSLENMTKRSLEERRALLAIYLENFKQLIGSDDIHKNETRINVIGRWREQFPDSLVTLLEQGINETKNYAKRSINFFLAYSGDDEMLQAVRSIAQKYSDPEEITRDVIKENLMTADLPPVDYLIRTGDDPHLSAGFMMWDVANAQLFFAKELYPDFDAETFKKAIAHYSERERRLGK